MTIPAPTHAAAPTTPAPTGGARHLLAASPGHLPGPALLVVVATVYLALAQVVIWLNDPVQLGAGFWPAAGVSLAMLLLHDRRKWPWILGGVALAEFGGDMVHGYPLGAVGLWTIGNVVEPLVGALLIQRFSSTEGSLTPVRAFIGFVALGVVAGPLVGASIGSLGTILVVGMPPAVVWPKYVVGDALGVLVVAPVLLTWTGPRVARSPYEFGALIMGATALTLLVFWAWGLFVLPYLIVPFLMWAALRFGVRGVAVLGLVVAFIASWATATGSGPFAVTGGTEHAVTLLQLFLAITLIASFVIASLASELTDSKAMARQQAEFNAEIQRSHELLDAYVGVLSHEIRTPVTTIFGMSHLLNKRLGSMQPEAIAEHLGDIEAESDRLRRLTDDLLVLSRAHGRRLMVATHPVMITHLLRATIDDERVKWSDHAFALEAPSRLPIVLGEDGYVEQVIRNLLNNAAKYSPPGTKICVVASRESAGLAVRVIDEGPGLHDQSPDRLFDLFYRAPGAVNTASGAGIGLFVCRELVKAMGGRVWARPGPGAKGAEFGFWLPEVPDGDHG